jgi:hypothetical protein
VADPTVTFSPGRERFEKNRLGPDPSFTGTHGVFLLFSMHWSIFLKRFIKKSVA